MADSDLTAELDRIEGRLGDSWEWATVGKTREEDAPRLVAALRKVLELTEPSGEVHRDLDGNEETGVVRVVRCDVLREAITREITGKGESPG